MSEIVRQGAGVGQPRGQGPPGPKAPVAGLWKPSVSAQSTKGLTLTCTRANVQECTWAAMHKSSVSSQQAQTETSVSGHDRKASQKLVSVLWQPLTPCELRQKTLPSSPCSACEAWEKHGHLQRPRMFPCLRPAHVDSCCQGWVLGRSMRSCTSWLLKIYQHQGTLTSCT